MKTNSTPLSKSWKHLSSAQREFLRAMHGKPTTFAKLQKRMKITPQQFAMWQRSKKFAAALQLALRGVRGRRYISMELNSLCASEKMGLLIYSTKVHIARQTCAHVLALAQKQEASETRIERAAVAQSGQRGAREALAEARPAKPMQELPPDLPLEEAERLLRRLESDDPPAPDPSPGTPGEAA